MTTSVNRVRLNEAILGNPATTVAERMSDSVRKIRSTQELRDADPAYQLFRIIKQAAIHVEDELSPENPKSVAKKAEDLVRNLPRWHESVQSMPIRGTYAVNLDREFDIEQEVLGISKDVVEKLRPLISNVEIENQKSEVQLGRLRKTLLSSLQSLLDFHNSPAADLPTNMGDDINGVGQLPHQKTNQGGT